MARAADPREPYVRPERLVRALSLPSPVASVEAILFALGRIIRDVIGVLISTGRAPQMLELTLIHSNEETSKLTLALIALAGMHSIFWGFYVIVWNRFKFTTPSKV